MKFAGFVAFSIMACVITSICGCSKPVSGCTDPTATNYNPNATVSNACSYNGNVMFYFNLNGPVATVVIDGESATITSGYQNSVPTCGSAGCANFNLPIGNYNYSATSTGGRWSGSLTVNDSVCVVQLLRQSTGDISFWTNNSQLLPIQVVLISQSGSADTVLSSVTIARGSQPTSCGASGCANFNLQPGIYGYKATGGGFTQNGTITIVADSCSGAITLG